MSTESCAELAPGSAGWVPSHIPACCVSLCRWGAAGALCVYPKASVSPHLFHLKVPLLQLSKALMKPQQSWAGGVPVFSFICILISSCILVLSFPILIDSDFKMKLFIQCVPVCSWAVVQCAAALRSVHWHCLPYTVLVWHCRTAQTALLWLLWRWYTHTFPAGRRECLLFIPLVQTWEHVGVGITVSSVNGSCQFPVFFCQHEMGFEARFEH